MKAQADRKRINRNFEVGEWVFLKLRPHGQHTIGACICPKLAPRYYGPFIVLQKIGNVAYKLQLPESARIHPVFHVSLLKKVVGDYRVEEHLPADLGGEQIATPEPAAVLAARTVVRRGENVRQIFGSVERKANRRCYLGGCIEYPESIPRIQT